MTYNLEEFKVWLNTDITRQQGLYLQPVFTFFTNNSSGFHQMVKENDYKDLKLSDQQWRKTFCWTTFRQVIANWKEKTDQAERERERTIIWWEFVFADTRSSLESVGNRKSVAQVAI